jgi:hypothetical protein
MTDSRNDDLMQGRATPTPPAPTLTDEIRARQHSRALVMALLLGAFVVLVFAIAIVKIQIATA